MTYRVFLFDFDGTLADSGPWLAIALNRAAQRFGFRPVNTAAEIEELRGLSSRQVIAKLGIPLWRLPRIAAHIRHMAKSEPPPPLFPGIPDMLAKLKASGRIVAVVSSNTEEAVRRGLGADRVGLIDHFACNAAIFGKAGAYKRALRRLGARPSEAIAIGDETRDIDAARRARIACGAVAWGYAAPATLLALKPDAFFERVEDIVALVDAGPLKDA